MDVDLAELQALQLASNTKLLVVDDEPLILASLEALLKHKHYQVATALGGKLACQQLEQNHYDLVLLDLNMVDVDGFAVMAFMADQGIDAAIVVVSGESTFDAVRKALRMGASDYVKKPYSPEELFATINSTFHKINLRIDALSAIVNVSSEQEADRENQRQSNTLFNKAEKIGKLGHWEWDAIEKQYITCSKQYANLHDATVDQMLAMRGDEEYWQFICEEDRVRYKKVSHEAWERKESWEIEYCRINAKGNRIYMLEKGEPVLDEHGTLIRTIGTVQDITERKQAEEKLKRMAHYDLLTELPNRVFLLDRLSQAMLQCQRHNQSLAVAYLDLDGFKAVNDTYGHHVGDELLVTLSRRMKEALRGGDTLARIGGDEFIAVMIDLEKIEDSEPVLERLLKAAIKPVTIGDALSQVSVSIGVAFYPQDDVDVDLLIRHADQAMYIAKQAGKNRYCFFDNVQPSLRSNG